MSQIVSFANKEDDSHKFDTYCISVLNCLFELLRLSFDICRSLDSTSWKHASRYLQVRRLAEGVEGGVLVLKVDITYFSTFAKSSNSTWLYSNSKILSLDIATKACSFLMTIFLL